MVSNLGKILDPLADKTTQFTLILCVCVKYPGLFRVMYPLVTLFVIKEIIQLLALVLACRRGLALPGALWSGKICTCVLFFSLILIVLLPDLPDRILSAIAVTDGCFLAFSFASYLLTYCMRQEKLQPLRPKQD